MVTFNISSLLYLYYCDYSKFTLIIQHTLLEYSDTFPVLNLRFDNILTMHDLFTMFDVHVVSQFLQECDFYKKIKDFIRLHVVHNFCQI